MVTLGELGEKIREHLKLSFVPKFLKYPISRKISPVYVVNPVPEHQEDATLTQAAPVQNTYYTVLETTQNCRLIRVTGRIETTGETLNFRITVDGQVILSDNLASVGS